MALSVPVSGGPFASHNGAYQKENEMKTISKFGLAAAVALIGAVGAAQAEDAVTVVSWGGAYTKSQVKAYHEPFSQKFNIKVNSVDYNGGLAEIKAQVEANNVTWDVVDVELSDAVRGCDEGLLEPIDKAVLPAAPDGTRRRKISSVVR